MHNNFSIPLLYKDHRENGKTTLRQAQLVELHLLYVIDAICNEYNLTYWLAWGSCLGAMRHKGFIPWDDDLDIEMPMEDYKKFLQIAPKVLPKDVLLQTPKDVPLQQNPFAKVRDAYSFFYESGRGMSTLDPSGIWVDIFPVEKLPAVGRKVNAFLIKAIGSSWMRSKYFLNRTHEGLVQAWMFSFIATLCGLTNLLSHIIIYLLRLALPGKLCNDVFDNGDVAILECDWVIQTKRMPFEDGNFPVPVATEKYLESLYGEWRQIPPENMRPRHATIIDVFHAAMIPGAMAYPQQLHRKSNLK